MLNSGQATFEVSMLRFHLRATCVCCNVMDSVENNKGKCEQWYVHHPLLLMVSLVYCWHSEGMQDVYDRCFGKVTICRWHKEFVGDQHSAELIPHGGWLITILTYVNVNTMAATSSIHINDGEAICIPFTTAQRFNHR